MRFFCLTIEFQQREVFQFKKKDEKECFPQNVERCVEEFGRSSSTCTFSLLYACARWCKGAGG